MLRRCDAATATGIVDLYTSSVAEHEAAAFNAFSQAPSVSSECIDEGSVAVYEHLQEE